VPATAKIGPAQVAVVGTTRHLSRDWNLRSAPTNLVIKK
jgi:hypothetical protein